MQKILILNYEFPPLGGGGGRVSYNLAEEWAKNGHQVDIITSHFKKLLRFEKGLNFKVYRVPIFGRKDLYTATFLSMFCYLINGFLKGFSLCKKEKYDLINTHFAIPTGPVGVLLSKIFKIKNILELHGGDIYNPNYKIKPHKNFILKKIIKWTLNNSEEIIAHSKDIKEKTVKFYQPNKDIKIIPISFKPFNYRKISRKELCLDENKFYLISVSRLIWRKRIDRIISALAEINNPQVELFIIGDGPERKNLENLSFKLKIKSKVHFLGYLSEEKKYQYLSCSNVFISTSEHEGFGINFQEAMSCGLPIVSTINGGQTDFLKEGRNAFFIDNGGNKNLAGAIKKLIHNKNLINKLGQNNQEDIKKFNIKRIAEKYLN